MYNDQQDPYRVYDPDGTPIDELMARLMQLQGKISSTVSDVQREVDGIRERQSQISQEIDQISLQVLEINTTMEDTRTQVAELIIRSDEIESSVTDIVEDITGINASISLISQRADNLSLSVTQLDSRVGTAEGRININSTNISSKVSISDYNGNTIASLINQTATSVSILANKINLLGITNVAEVLTIGSGGGRTASIRFNGLDTWLESAGDGLRLSSLGTFDVRAVDMTFYSTTVNLGTARSIIWGGNAPTNVAWANQAGSLSGYTASRFAKNALSHQDISFEITSTGGLRATVNGRTATYSPTSWS